MGNYLLVAELKTRFRDEADVAFFTDEEEAGTATDSRVEDAIATAEGMLNSRFAKRYATPVDVSVDTELAATLKRLTLNVAQVVLIGKHSEVVSEWMVKQHDDALVWADKIASGEFVLPGAVTPAGPTSRDPAASWSDHTRTLATTSGRVFTRSTMGRL